MTSFQEVSGLSGHKWRILNTLKGISVIKEVWAIPGLGS